MRQRKPNAVFHFKVTLLSWPLLSSYHFGDFLTMMARKKLSTEQLQLLTFHPFQFLEFRCYTYACMYSDILLFSRLSLYCEGILVCKLEHCPKSHGAIFINYWASTMNPSSNIAIEKIQCCFAKLNLNL